MIIKNPQLPPKQGYVEVEIDGVRQYKKIPTERDKELEQLTSANAALQEAVDLLTIAMLEG